LPSPADIFTTQTGFKQSVKNARPLFCPYQAKDGYMYQV